jgi:flagellar hook assembly protein FlgD
LTLNGNFPNPFNQLTSIEFEIAASGSVEIMIYDNVGNQIQKLECQNCIAGKNTLQWNCLDIKNNKVQNGVYFYEVRFNTDVQSKKMIVVK